LRAAALSLETSNYSAFDEFEERLKAIIAAGEVTIDSDFFTRVGLRYVNLLPFNVAEIRDWVNPALVTPLGDGTFGDVDEHWQTVRGSTSMGGYYLRHGVGNPGPNGVREYLLDFDFYREDVPLADALGVVRKLHELEFSMFMWTLGPKAKAELGPSMLKGKK
jgi:uncharacterized protein (TIGR04255 family)